MPGLISRKDHQARTYGSSWRHSTKLKCKKYLLAMWQVSFSMVLQTLQSVQLFLSPYFTMLLQCKALPSIANEALQTLQSVSCSFLCILPCFLQCKAFPSIANEALQTLQFSQLFISPRKVCGPGSVILRATPSAAGPPTCDLCLQLSFYVACYLAVMAGWLAGWLLATEI